MTSSSDANVLLVDDDSDVTLSLARALKATALPAKIHIASNALQAQKLFDSEHPEAVVLDLSLDDSIGVESGFQLLREIQAADNTTRIIVLTGHGSLEHGIRSLREGAASFLEKPAHIEHLDALLRDSITQARIRRSYEQIRSEHIPASKLIGTSRAIQEVREAIQYVATTNQAVLINGETGTGKGLTARVIHEESARNNKHFVRYQTTHTTSDLTNSELFGHKKGAFTGADEDRLGLLHEAEGGTLFLDEIDELPHDTQVMLLGVLQEKEYRPVGSNKVEKADFRLVTATNADLSQCLEEGKLREDLYHRIAHVVIELPPLRERIEDIAPLSEHILQELQEREGLQVFEVGKEATELLQSHQWPGNIRELQANVEGAAYHAQFKKRRVITPEDIRLRTSKRKESDKCFREQVEDFQQKLVREALQKTGGHQIEAAKELQMDRSSLRRILARMK